MQSVLVYERFRQTEKYVLASCDDTEGEVHCVGDANHYNVICMYMRTFTKSIL
jgi:hypothetical protein